MEKVLQGQTAVVTGAGRGIAREIALELAQRGAKVAALARTASEIDETAALIARRGGEAQAVSVDLIDFSALETALDRVTRDIGPFDLLVNNHGSFRAYGPVREVDPVEWRADIEINLHGSFHTCRVLAPWMLASGKGLSSTSSAVAWVGAFPMVPAMRRAKPG